MKKNWLKLGLITLAFQISFVSCKEETTKENMETNEISFEKEGELYLIKNSGDTIQKLDIEFAKTPYEIETGLMYREGMEDNQGMLFVYNYSSQHGFWMKNTYFPLDIIYFDTDSTLVNIQANAEPRSETSLPSDGPVQFVLEINGGLSEKWNLEKGDKISFEEL